MRVGVLTTSYPRDADDPAGGFVAGFSRWLARHADVEVLCAHERRPLFYRGGAPGALRENWGEAARFTARFAATAARRARGWDALVSHWLVPSGAIGWMLRKPHLAVAHGSDVRLLRRLPGGARLVRQIAAASDLVYVATDLMMEGAPGRVVPMGVEVAALAGGDGARMRRVLGLGEFTALYLGRLVPEKGVDRAIDEVPEGVELLIAGAGPLRAELEQRARGKRVRFLGEMRGADKRDLLAAVDALIVPSREDAAPTVILEALAAGLPIVAEPVGGIPELVGDAGLLSLIELARLRDDRELRKRLSERAKKRAANFDWQVIGPRLAHNLPLPLSRGGRAGTVQVTRV